MIGSLIRLIYGPNIRQKSLIVAVTRSLAVPVIYMESAKSGSVAAWYFIECVHSSTHAPTRSTLSAGLAAKRTQTTAPNESSCCFAAPNPMKAARPPWQSNRVHHCEKCRTNALSHRERVAAGRVRVASTRRLANRRPSSGLRPPSPGGRRTYHTGGTGLSEQANLAAPNEANPPRRTKPISRAKRSQSAAPNEANLAAQTKPIRRAERSQSRRETKPISPRRTKPIRRAERSHCVLVIHCERGGYGIESDRRGSRMERSFKPTLTRPSATFSRRERERNADFRRETKPNSPRRTKPIAPRNEAKLAAPNEANLDAKRSQTRRAERIVMVYRCTQPHESGAVSSIIDPLPSLRGVLFVGPLPPGEGGRRPGEGFFDNIGLRIADPCMSKTRVTVLKKPGFPLHHAVKEPGFSTQSLIRPAATFSRWEKDYWRRDFQSKPISPRRAESNGCIWSCADAPTEPPCCQAAEPYLLPHQE